MSKSAQAVKIPGDGDDLPPSKAPSDLLNNAGRGTANDVGLQHERTAKALAMAAAVQRGENPDLAAMAAIGNEEGAPPTSIKRRMRIGGEMVDVEVPLVKKNGDVEKFGPESRLAKGTNVRKDGMPCEGDEQPFGIVGDIITPHGRLVNRVIPVEA
jgi:hypothetical protein